MVSELFIAVREEIVRVKEDKTREIARSLKLISEGEGDEGVVVEYLD